MNQVCEKTRMGVVGVALSLLNVLRECFYTLNEEEQIQQKIVSRKSFLWKFRTIKYFSCLWWALKIARIRLFMIVEQFFGGEMTPPLSHFRKKYGENDGKNV